jgi:serine/threonine-protein kinase
VNHAHLRNHLLDRHPPRDGLGLRPDLLKATDGDSAHVAKAEVRGHAAQGSNRDRYRFVGEIARDGMGPELRGRDVDLAVRVLLRKYVDRPQVARRFVEKAQIGGQLQQPGEVRVYDIGRLGDRPYITMKLVKRQTLAAILDEHEGPPTDWGLAEVLVEWGVADEELAGGAHSETVDVTTIRTALSTGSTGGYGKRGRC